MSHLLPTWSLLSSFLVASVVLAITPGPGVIYIVSLTLAHGRTTGLVSALGVALGNLGNALAASLGLAALMAVSSTVFSMVQYIGAAYLLYLGLQLWFKQPLSTATANTLSQHNRPQKVFMDGVIVALFNPKTTLFYAAFLPQFLTYTINPMAQSLLLASLFIFICMITDSCYALAASHYTTRLNRWLQHKRLGQRISGSLLIGLGIFTASYRAR